MNRPVAATGMTPAERARLSGEMLAFLRRHVIDAWFPRSIDREAGGFLCDFDGRWRPHGAQRRMLEFQARQTRAAARLSQMFPRESVFAEAAQHGFRYLRDVMWDRTHGGWFWMIARDGAILEEGSKHAHSTAYAVQACALVFAVTGEHAALELAQEGHAWFHRVAEDREQGGYHGWLHRDGTVIRQADTSALDPLGHGVGLKDVNVHGDWLESLTEFMTIRPDTAVARQIESLTECILRHFIGAGGAMYDNCGADWKPEPTLERYGYHMQTAHRLRAVLPFLASPDGAARAAIEVLDHGMARGWAGPSGGIWYAGPSGPPDDLEGVPLVVRRRAWWVQFEALRALLLFGLGNDGSNVRYLDYARQQWTFIRSRMADERYGGVFATCPDDRPRVSRAIARWRPGGMGKGGVWKDASHEAESLLACLRLLA